MSVAEEEKVINLANASAMRKINEQLAKSDKGIMLPSVSNLQIIIDQDPGLTKLVGYDEFQCCPVLLRAVPSPISNAEPIPGPYPRVWEEPDETHVQTYIQRVYNQTVVRATVRDAMESVASLRRFHPVRDWLDSLHHDGQPRIDTWLAEAFGSDPESDYIREVGSKFLIGAVRRIRQPGVKCDTMPVFEGQQGIKKSSTLAALFGQAFFTDSIPAKLESADAGLAVEGVWCVEFADLEQLIRTEVQIIKAFLTRNVDRFRSPYGRRPTRHPRQCVFAGTTNENDWARDATGNRRFWPVPCQFANMDWVTQNRDQLWAEASAREAAAEDHWITEPDTLKQAAKEQAGRLQDDPWEKKIWGWVDGGDEISISDILGEALGLGTLHQDKKAQMRVADIMKKAGWQRRLVRPKTGPLDKDGQPKPQRLWVRPEE